MKRLKRAMYMILTASILLGMMGCGSKKIITIASKPMTEQYILTEIMRILIEENTDYEVKITKGIGGGTTNIHPALLKGDFDIYPEYTRTAWLNVLKEESMEKDDSKLFDRLQTEYGKMGLKWIGLYGYSNTYGLAVRQETADQYNMTTYSDLAAVSDQLIFGGNPDYIELNTGYQRLCDAFGMNFKDTKQMEIALKYEALIHNEVDVMNAFTTDAQLEANHLVLLEDDASFFETFLAGTIVRADTLERFPELEETLALMNGLISLEEIRKMNYEVEVEGKEDAAVARDFLQTKGLIP